VNVSAADKSTGKQNNITSSPTTRVVKTAGDELDSINSVSEVIVHDDLKLFLETNMPKGGIGAFLGVSDSKLSTSINETCSIKCSHIGFIPEVTRGIRQHFLKVVKGFSPLSSNKFS